MKLALIGATGLVGREMITVMEEFMLPVTQFIPVASSRSAGKTVTYKGTSFPIVSIEEALSLRPHIVMYSAGSEISLKTAESFASAGTYVIDNSSAWRMHNNIPLVVPEVNIHTVTPDTKIIANPNCSTIQLAVVLHPLHVKFRIKKIVISTYQSVTGTGAAAVKQLEAEKTGQAHEKVYPYQIENNCFPHGGSFTENGYTTEEMKLVNETKKILNDTSLLIAPTVVRIPVTGGHSESVYIEFDMPVQPEEIRQTLANAQGIVIQDNPKNNEYPMPLFAKGKNETFAGRIRTGLCGENTAQLWIVADNLRKGAATNAIQIADHIIRNIL
jgi:aspartate-semialdehyde dehydrogenase